MKFHHSTLPRPGNLANLPAVCSQFLLDPSQATSLYPLAHFLAPFLWPPHWPLILAVGIIPLPVTQRASCITHLLPLLSAHGGMSAARDWSGTINMQCTCPALPGLSWAASFPTSKLWSSSFALAAGLNQVVWWGAYKNLQEAPHFLLDLPSGILLYFLLLEAPSSTPLTLLPSQPSTK